MPDGAREIIEAADRLGESWVAMMKALDTFHLSLGGPGDGRTTRPSGLPLLPINPRPAGCDRREVA